MTVTQLKSGDYKATLQTADGAVFEVINADKDIAIDWCYRSYNQYLNNNGRGYQEEDMVY